MSRLFKKSSNDGNLTLFLPKRELHMQGETGTVENLEGVVLIYKELASRPTEVKVFIQVRRSYEPAGNAGDKCSVVDPDPK